MSDHIFDLNSATLTSDPFPELRRLLSEGPLVRARIPFIGKTWAATSYAAVDELLRDSDRFVRNPARAGKTLMAGMQWWMPRILRVLGQNMLAYDGHKHRRLRQLVEKAFVKHQRGKHETPH